MRLLPISLVALFVSLSAAAEVPLAQIHARNSFDYEVLREPIHSCQRSNLRLRSIRVVSGGDLKANMAIVHFADGSTQNGNFYKDTFGGGETVTEIFFGQPRCVESISLRLRSKTRHGGTMVHVSGEEAYDGWDRPAPHHPGRPDWNRPGRPDWGRPTPPPAPYQPPFNPPAPPVEKRAVEVVFSSQKNCGDLRQTVYVRRHEHEQKQLCDAASAQAGGRIMRTALVKFNDGSQSCENITDGDLASVCMNVLRSVR